MITRRLVVNLVVFFVVSAALVAFGFADLIGNPLRAPTTISAVFPDASGLFPNFSVELNGVDVGSVSSIHLERAGARVTMAIDHGVEVPDDVVASIAVANDLGEQVVELTPVRRKPDPPDPPLADGAVVPVVSGGIPVALGKVVSQASRLLAAIPAGDLNHVLSDLATALSGRAADLRTIATASSTFSHEFLSYQKQVDALLANAPPIMDTVSADATSLRQALVNTEAVLGVVTHDRAVLDPLFKNSAQATNQLDQLFSNQEADLGCITHDFSDLAANLDQPTNLSNLSAALAKNEYFFGAVDGSAVAGKAVGLSATDPGNPDQFFLRTRLLIPPASPSGDAYAAQQGLPDILPAAGCSTELGQGVGPASQPGFTPAAGGRVIAPTAAEAQVRGGGDPSSPESVQSAYRTPAPGWPLMVTDDVLVFTLVGLPLVILSGRTARGRRRLVRWLRHRRA